MRVFAAFICGTIFGTGLVLSEMINPRRVLGFLDITGQWDPTLLFVMAGGLSVTALGYRLVLKQSRPMFADTFSLPAKKDIDAKLVTGAALFGLGWGLSGICPGPAITAASIGGIPILVFLTAMALGFVFVNVSGLITQSGKTTIR